MRTAVKTQETYRGNFRSNRRRVTGWAGDRAHSAGAASLLSPRSSGARARRGAKVRGEDRGGMLGAEANRITGPKENALAMPTIQF